MRSGMSLIMGQIETKHPELFALEFGKIAESDFVYTLASTNFKVPIASNYKGVCLQNTSKFHSYHLRIWHLL